MRVGYFQFDPVFGAVARNLDHVSARLGQVDADLIVLRAVVESTIKFHFEGTATPATGELGPCMALVKVTYGSGRSPVKSAISRVHSADVKTPGSVHWFNDVCHSSDAVTTADTVRDAFKLVHPLLRLLLRPPSGAP